MNVTSLLEVFCNFKHARHFIWQKEKKSKHCNNTKQDEMVIYLPNMVIMVKKGSRQSIIFRPEIYYITNTNKGNTKTYNDSKQDKNNCSRNWGGYANSG